MRQAIFWKILTLFVCCSSYSGCRNTPAFIKSTYHYIKPVYNDIQLLPQSDSLHFALSDNTYNSIESFNYFLHNDKAFIAFYDDRSQSINIYDFSSQRRIKKINLKRWLKGQQLYKTSVYLRNFDSIFIANQRVLYMFDSTGYIKKDIDFVNDNHEYALLDNSHQGGLKANSLYIGIRPYVEEASFSALKQWRVMYRFDLEKEIKERVYPLPEAYHKNLYGYLFLYYNYCINSKGNFVFSFTADTNIYETNLTDYHMAYYGKSRFQNEVIKPVSKETIESDDSLAREFRLSDSYGTIYYDPFRKRYLRLARQGISEAEYKSNNKLKKQSLILFDENFRIIGEPEFNSDFSFSSVFFAADGQIYARINSRDEYALHFVRLAYVENKNMQLSKK